MGRSFVPSATNIVLTYWWHSEPDVGRVANGVAYRVDRLKAIGNGQVPIVAKNAFEYLNGASHEP